MMSYKDQVDKILQIQEVLGVLEKQATENTPVHAVSAVVHCTTDILATVPVC